MVDYNELISSVISKIREEKGVSIAYKKRGRLNVAYRTVLLHNLIEYDIPMKSIKEFFESDNDIHNYKTTYESNKHDSTYKEIDKYVSSIVRNERRKQLLANPITYYASCKHYALIPFDGEGRCIRCAFSEDEEQCSKAPCNEEDKYGIRGYFRQYYKY